VAVVADLAQHMGAQVVQVAEQAEHRAVTQHQEGNPLLGREAMALLLATIKVVVAVEKLLML
jgi:hypothetical protein